MLRFLSSTKISAPLVLAVLTVAFLVAVGFRLDTLPHTPQAPFSDATISRYPDALHFRRSLLDHQTFPQWNSHLMAGQPFAANPGSKVWYPLTWLLVIWPPELHINLMTAFHLWLGGLGMWFWARRTGLQMASAWLAALAYLFAPKLMAHAGTGHLDLLMAMAWFPWLLLAAFHLMREKVSVWGIVGVGVAAAMIFTGAIQLTPYLFGATAVYAFALIPRDHPQKILPLLLAGIVALGLTAVQWMPLFALRDSLSRGDIREADAGIFSIKVGQLFGLLIGDHGGNAETMTYLGISVAVLALMGLLLHPRRNRWAWALVTVALVYALGENFILWKGLVKVFPPLLWFRVPSRAWLLVVALMPYLAGWGLQSLIEKPPSTARARLGIVGFIGFGLTCAIASQFILADTEIEQAALIGMFSLPLTALLIALVIFQKVELRWLLIAFVVLVTLDTLWMDRTLIEGRPRQEWLQQEPPDLIAHLAESGARIYTPDYSIPQQDTAYWGIARFDGVDPFQIAEFIDITEAATGVPRQGYSTTVPAVVVLEADEATHQYQDAPMDAELLGAWGVEWVITGYEIEIDGLSLADEIDGRYFYENAFFAEDFHLEWHGPNAFSEYENLTGAPSLGYPDEHSLSDIESWSIADSAGFFYYATPGLLPGFLLSGLTLVIAMASLVWNRARARV
jgi:hypothetical protein